VTVQMLAYTLLLAVALAMLFAGSAVGLTGASIAKRVGGVLVALTGAMLGLAALGAGSSVLVAAVAVTLAYSAIGVAILVRMQERYGDVETQSANSADQTDEPLEPRS
jgi:hypothetical protein